MSDKLIKTESEVESEEGVSSEPAASTFIPSPRVALVNYMFHVSRCVLCGARPVRDCPEGEQLWRVYVTVYITMSVPNERPNTDPNASHLPDP